MAPEGSPHLRMPFCPQPRPGNGERLSLAEIQRATLCQAHQRRTSCSSSTNRGQRIPAFIATSSRWSATVRIRYWFAGCATLLLVTAVISVVVTIAPRLTYYLVTRGQSLALAEAARSRVAVGMPVDVAVRELRSAEGFWHQASCPPDQPDPPGRVAYPYAMFFYGVHDPTEAGIVSLLAKGPPGSETVAFVGMPDPDDGPGRYRYCLDRDPPP